VLRHYGRFLDRYQGVPVRILNHLNRQLGLMPTRLLVGGRARRNRIEPSTTPPRIIGLSNLR
jgi:hypothetical protein